jgi:Putative restriction endonuclease
MEKRAFRGPDVFWVGGIDAGRKREAWIAWEEGGRLPDVVFEMLSPSTAKKDRTEKRDLYARAFRTAEYFLYEPETRELEGLRLAGRFYQPIQPDENGRLWSEELGASVGLWHGGVKGKEDDWVRLFRPDGSLIPTEAEAQRRQTEAERERAEAERRRADEAEAELARLRLLSPLERFADRVQDVLRRRPRADGRHIEGRGVRPLWHDAELIAVAALDDDLLPARLLQNGGEVLTSLSKRVDLHDSHQELNAQDTGDLPHLPVKGDERPTTRQRAVEVVGIIRIDTVGESQGEGQAGRISASSSRLFLRSATSALPTS